MRFDTRGRKASPFILQCIKTLSALTASATASGEVGPGARAAVAVGERFDWGELHQLLTALLIDQRSVNVRRTLGGRLSPRILAIVSSSRIMHTYRSIDTIELSVFALTFPASNSVLSIVCSGFSQ